MKAFLNLIQGFKQSTAAWRMVGLLLLINLLFSLLLAMPMYHSLNDSFGSSQVTERMGEGFDYLWWEEFRDQADAWERTFSPSLIGKGAILNNLEGLIQMRFLELPPSLLFFGFLYLLLHSFLAGGILAIFSPNHTAFRMKTFLTGSGKFFPRFLGIMLISWIFVFGGVGLLSDWLRSLVNKMASSAASEVTPFFLNLIVSACVLFLLLFVQMVFDYARIKTVLTNQRNIFKSVLSAFSFVFKHLGSSLGLFYLLFLANILVTLAYLGLVNIVQDTNFLGILASFLIQQLFIFAVIWVRCWLYSSQMKLHQYLQ
ncbi:MAG: hypothetical protein GQ544_08630 [Candidatus Aminicenantes bacterium]|nr:hypothetical protein [Candidatus Aminicenantes bacterium]